MDINLLVFLSSTLYTEVAKRGVIMLLRDSHKFLHLAMVTSPEELPLRSV
ncbi:hypothetical protein Plhal304r1_c056g0142081 [Plasmopara halstedii]